MNRLVKWTASVAGLGYLPAGGTFGSAAGFAIAWTFNDALAAWTILACVVGIALCKPAVRAFGTVDPHPFVLDEVAGMFISVLFLEKNFAIFLAAFILFRALDVLKPWPISIFQRNTRALDIMWDDLAAGALVNVFLRLGLLIFRQFQP